MPIYRDTDRDSGIRSYEYGNDWIEVEFKSGKQRFYMYTDTSVGSHHLGVMKTLADAGDGLNSYINKNVAKQYASKR